MASLREMVDWAAETGFSLLQLLPINETGADNSPYMAISSVAIEPATLELTPERVPGLGQEMLDKALSKVDMRRLREGSVAYPVVKPLKLQLLECAFEQFSITDLARNTRRARDFRHWSAEQAEWLDGYSLFRGPHGRERRQRTLGPVVRRAADIRRGGGLARATAGRGAQAHRAAGPLLQVGAVGRFCAVGGSEATRRKARGLAHGRCAVWSVLLFLRCIFRAGLVRPEMERRRTA